MTRISQLIISLVISSLVIVSVINGIYVLRSGVADAETLAVRLALIDYKTNGTIPPAKESRDIQLALDDAIKLQPEATLYYEDQGYLYGVSSEDSNDPNAVRVDLLRAQSNYLSVLFLKPMSSSTWANLALLSNYLDSNNVRETERLFDIAMHFGECDPTTTVILFYLGTRSWQELSQEKRLILQAKLTRSKGELRNRLLAIRRELSQPK